MQILRQNDPLWGPRTLGASKLTIGRAGCLLTDLTMARNFLHGNGKDITPAEANDLCLAAGAFRGALLLVEKAAKALGLNAPDSQRIRSSVTGDERMGTRVKDVLLNGGVAIIHVDHDSMKVGGDPEGDHFVLAYKHVKPDVGPEHFECADSAPGRVVWLDAEECTGTSRWSTTTLKVYRGVGVIPVWRS